MHRSASKAASSGSSGDSDLDEFQELLANFQSWDKERKAAFRNAFKAADPNFGSSQGLKTSPANQESAERGDSSSVAAPDGPQQSASFCAGTATEHGTPPGLGAGEETLRREPKGTKMWW